MDQSAKQLWGFVADDNAATAIEYGMIASIISIAIAVISFQIGSSLVLIFEQVDTVL